MNETNTNEDALNAEAEEMRKVLDKPISDSEARAMYAESDINKAQLRVARQRVMTQITQLQLKLNTIDESLLCIDLANAVTFRRTLNGKGADDSDAAQG